jgi:hypothetical protein
MFRGLENRLAQRDLNARKQKLVQDFRAVGGTIEQLHAIKDLLSSRQIASSSLIYFNSRLLPIMFRG